MRCKPAAVRLKPLLFAPLLAIWSLHTMAVDCQFEMKNQWSSGFTGSVSIMNNTPNTLSGWSVTLDFPDGATMGSPWNGTLTETEPYTVVNANYNGKISPGDTKTFGFNGHKAVPGIDLVSPELGGDCNIGDNDMMSPPGIEVSATEGEMPLTVVFNGNRTDESVNSLSYLWDFGDGNQATGQRVEHVFTTVGRYTTRLTLSDGQNQSSSSVTIDVVAPEPKDALCEFSVKNEWQAGFTGEVKIHNDGSHAIQDWQVNMVFPDETTVSGAWNASHSGNNPYEFINASYNASIPPGNAVQFGFNAQKATSGGDVNPPDLSGICRKADNNAPESMITSDVIQGVAPLTISLSGTSSSDVNGDSLTYQWWLDNNVISQEASFEFLFELPGTYDISLVVHDGTLASAPATLTILVQAPDDDSGDDNEQDETIPWTLSLEKSSLHFVSTKKTHVMEVHHFQDFTGSIDTDGQALLSIPLDSVDTGIALRNERMREHLFETHLYPDATVSLAVDPLFITGLEIGATASLEVLPLLTLHGLSLPIPTKVRVTRLSHHKLLIVSAEPVVLEAAEFELLDGIATLMSLAGLDMISPAIVINFTLLFEPIIRS